MGIIGTQGMNDNEVFSQENELASFDNNINDATLCSSSAPPCGSSETRKRRSLQTTCNKARASSVAGLVVPPDNCFYYGYTLNICPDKVMNGRKYKNYSLKDQEKLLHRLLMAALKDVSNKNHYCILSDMSYEVCPLLGQTHIHLMLLSSVTGLQMFDEYLVCRCHSGVGWRTTYTELCYDAKGWKEYIHKGEYFSSNY